MVSCQEPTLNCAKEAQAASCPGFPYFATRKGQPRLCRILQGLPIALSPVTPCPGSHSGCGGFGNDSSVFLDPSHFRKCLRELMQQSRGISYQEYQLKQHLLMSSHSAEPASKWLLQQNLRLSTHASAHVGLQGFEFRGQVLGSKLKTRLRFPAAALDTEAFRDGIRPQPSRRHSRSWVMP